jgi:hypothetical protein
MTMHIGKMPRDKTKRALEPPQNTQGGTRNTTSYLRGLHALAGWGLSQLGSESVAVEGIRGGNAQTHILVTKAPVNKACVTVSSKMVGLQAQPVLFALMILPFQALAAELRFPRDTCPPGSCCCGAACAKDSIGTSACSSCCCSVGPKGQCISNATSCSASASCRCEKCGLTGTGCVPSPTPPTPAPKYACDYKTLKCKEDPHGNSSSMAECSKTCCEVPLNCGMYNNTEVCGHKYTICDVCSTCCHEWLKPQSICDGCVAEECTSGRNPDCCVSFECADGKCQRAFRATGSYPSLVACEVACD